MSFITKYFRPPSRPKPIPFPSPGDNMNTGIITHLGQPETRNFEKPILPPIGAFTFPGYNTRATRLTPLGYQYNPVGYAYWNNINYHKDRDILHVLVSGNNNLGIITVHKFNLDVLSHQFMDIHHTGEGCYFSKRDPNLLYIPYQNHLLRRNIITHDTEVVIQRPNGTYVWQPHSSWNDNVHSYTWKNDNAVLSWCVNDREVAVQGNSDECQIDKSGQYLLIKEGNDVRILDLQTDQEQFMFNQSGAPGHSDMGFGCVIGEDDYATKPGSLIYWSLVPPNSRIPMWHRDKWNMGHVSFCNAQNKNITEQKCLVSGGEGNELFSVRLDGTGRALAICQDLTESREYHYLPKANICPVGEFACWSALINGRVEIFVVRIPEW